MNTPPRAKSRTTRQMCNEGGMDRRGGDSVGVSIGVGQNFGGGGGAMR